MKTVRVIAVFGLLIILALTVAAGGDTDDGASREAVEYKTHDDLLLDIGRRVPEFGGMYLAEDNSVLYVYVLDGAKSSLGIEEVKRAIDDVLKDSPTQRRELRLIPAQYSMLQLYEWYAKLQSFVFTNPNVVMTDLDEGRNRIEIGVDSLEETGALEKLLASADIPRKAVVFQVRARPQLAAHSLQDRATGGAMEGGYQITGQGLFACTLGFNVVRGGAAGLVTAGHCTDPTPHDWLGGVDGTEFFQPSSGVNGTAIGEETIDPDFSSDPPLCEAGKVCRYSDAAFIRAAPGLSQNRGKIAKPTALGSIDVDHGSTFRIVREGYASEGEVVHKVGRTTGGTARLEPYTLIWQAVIRGTRAPRRTIANANLDVSLAIVEGG